MHMRQHMFVYWPENLTGTKLFGQSVPAEACPKRSDMYRYTTYIGVNIYIYIYSYMHAYTSTLTNILCVYQYR